MFGKKSYTCSFGFRTKFVLSFYAGFIGLLVASLLLVHVEAKETRHPIILVPGIGGSKLEAKLDKSQAKFRCTKRTSDYKTLWLEYTELIRKNRHCFIDNIRLEYDLKTRSTRNSPGVRIRVPGFGNTSTIEHLDDLKKYPYFKSAVEHFTNLGFRRGVNILGAPYDFRKSPSELSNFFDDLTYLVENTYDLNQGTSVILVCHSTGCQMTLYFLNQMTSSWKEKYIRAFVTLGAPWEGAVKALKVAISGDDMDHAELNPDIIWEASKTFPSLYYLLPSEKFWSEEEILVKTPSAKYTVKDYKDIFNEARSYEAYNMWLDSKNITTYDLIPPEVEVHCIHGSKLDTVESLEFSKTLGKHRQPEVKYGDGDGTVNLRSLMGCLRWIGKQPQPVHYIQIQKVEHMEIVKHNDVLDRIEKLAFGKY